MLHSRNSPFLDRPCYAVRNRTKDMVLATEVRIARTSAERREGLRYVNLEDQAGLWIAPCEAVHTFGMKSAIDLIFLDRDHRVKALRHRVKPRRLAAALTAYSVLELSGGAIARTTVDRGDQLEFVKHVTP